MQIRLASILVLSIAAIAWAPPAALASPQREQSKPQKKTPASPKLASLSGCIDEQNGTYVLIHDQTLTPIANLEADGFSTEGFAKHLGHKVTVRGISNQSGTERPTFKVRTIETISDTCGSQAH